MQMRYYWYFDIVSVDILCSKIMSMYNIWFILLNTLDNSLILMHETGTKSISESSGYSL